MKVKNNILLLLAAFLCTVALHAQDTVSIDINAVKLEADSAFAQEKYDEAAEMYRNVYDATESSQVCYNLGCSYYRLDSIAKSVLWFERALLLDCGNEDIRFNLELARSKTIDKITPVHEIFFLSLYRSIVNMMNLHGWAVVCIVCFCLALIGLALFFFSDKMALRKTGFYSFIVFFLLVILGNVCGYQQRYYAQNRNSGIIMSSAVTVKSTPAENGNDLFVIHEGTKVEIQDSTLKEWCEIKIADGKVGWIRKDVMEVI